MDGSQPSLENYLNRICTELSPLAAIADPTKRKIKKILAQDALGITKLITINTRSLR